MAAGRRGALVDGAAHRGHDVGVVDAEIEAIFVLLEAPLVDVRRAIGLAVLSTARMTGFVAPYMTQWWWIVSFVALLALVWTVVSLLDLADARSLAVGALGVAVVELVKSGPTAPSPNEVALHRLRDLLEWDGGDGPERMRKAIEVAWMERFGSAAERRSCREVTTCLTSMWATRTMSATMAQVVSTASTSPSLIFCSACAACSGNCMDSKASAMLICSSMGSTEVSPIRYSEPGCGSLAARAIISSDSRWAGDRRKAPAAFALAAGVEVSRGAAIAPEEESAAPAPNEAAGEGSPATRGSE